MLQINEKEIPFSEGLTPADFAQTVKPDADLFIVNGYPVSSDTPLRDGDVCCCIKKGEIPSHEEMECLLTARHTPGVHKIAKKSVVGIMGLGGLGSPLAVALTRVGVGKLLLADFDVVEPSNLNRQQYFVDQIGKKKTEALKENLLRMNPYINIETIDKRLTEDNIANIFDNVDVLAECFDDAVMKAAALRAVLTSLPDTYYVGASGMAGYEENNMITTKQLYPKVFIVGDGTSAACPGQGLMAPRVGIAAHHQANQVLRLLIKKDN